MKMNVHIERLVLDGLPLESHDGTRVQAAAIAELERLLREGGISRQLSSAGAMSEVRADEFQIGDPAGPAPVGKQIARAVFRGLENPK